MRGRGGDMEKRGKGRRGEELARAVGDWATGDFVIGGRSGSGRRQQNGVLCATGVMKRERPCAVVRGIDTDILNTIILKVPYCTKVELYLTAYCTAISNIIIVTL
jgi:hypothetical protein